MYQDIRKERLHRMQSLPGQSSKNNLSTIILIAILLFALSGLISGFAVGAFVRPNLSQLTNPNAGTTQSPDQTGPAATATVKPTTHPIFLGEPIISRNYSYIEVVNGTTNYTLSAQVVDKKNNKPVHASDITCKLWLTKDGDVNSNMPASRLTAIDTISNPFPQETIDGLIFDPTTLQTQFCNSNGVTTWKYKVASFVDPGTYYLVVLTDWKGVHYNWSWVGITITKKAD